MDPDVKGTLSFLRRISMLKSIKRTGWLQSHVQNAESIADHSFRVAIAAMLLSDSSLDCNKTTIVTPEKCIRMALVHDMAECIVGDYTPLDPITRDEKQKKERAAIDSLASFLPKNSRLNPNTIKSLWEEFEAGVTPEAQAVQQLDKFEMVLQARQYEEEQDLNLEDFFRSTQGLFSHPEITKWDKAIRGERKRSNK